MNFLYVQAIVTVGDLTTEGPGAIRFRHTVVTADTPPDAYAEGGRWSDANPPHRDGYHPQDEVINDYVLFIPEGDWKSA